MNLSELLERLLLRLLRPLIGRKSFNPRFDEKASFHSRAETKTEGGVTVSVAVLSARESRKLFDANLALFGVQPIWLNIENKEDNLFYVIRTSIDPDYLSPFEVARRLHTHLNKRVDQKIDRFIRSVGLASEIPPKSFQSGFVFTNIDEDYKLVNVELLSRASIRKFFFIQDIPGMRFDYSRTDFNTIYAEEAMDDCVDEHQFRKALEKLPGHTRGGDRITPGDPLNLIFIGHDTDIAAAYRRRGWDETEVTYFASAWKTLRSLIFRSRYRHSPVSALYTFDRRQDIALQKARSTIAARNHLRIWLTPLRYRGMNVFIGQISRDIGLRLTWKTGITHKIDPDIDEAREYILLDLASSQGLSAIGFVKGVGAAEIEKPHFNYTNDPYFTDGYRAVLFFTSSPTSLSDIRLLDWEWPPVVSPVEI